MESFDAESGVRPRWTFLMVAAALSLLWAQAAWADDSLIRVAEVLGQVVKGADCSPNCKAPPKPRVTVMGREAAKGLQTVSRKDVERLHAKAHHPVTADGLVGMWEIVLEAYGKEGSLDRNGLPWNPGLRLGISVGSGGQVAVQFFQLHADRADLKDLGYRASHTFAAVRLTDSSLTFEDSRYYSHSEESETSLFDCRLLNADNLLCRKEYATWSRSKGAVNTGSGYFGVLRDEYTALPTAGPPAPPAFPPPPGPRPRK